MPLKNLWTIGLIAAISVACYFRAERNRYASSIAKAMDIISTSYVDDIGYRQLYEHAMEGMAERLDPYSAYISPSDYQRFVEGLDQEFGGIGILVELGESTNRLTVMSPLVDTPAYRAGILAGDTIVSIDHQDTTGMSLEEAVDLMRGPPGDIVHLVLLHSGSEEPVELDIERAIIPIESALGDQRHEDGSWSFELAEEPRITYIRLTTFGDHSVSELKEILEDRDVEALIIDLRDNAGGLLSAAVGTCDLFLREGTIVSTRGRDGVVRSDYKATKKTLLPADVPMVVLVNHFSASASEIVAACLQDHRRATVIGARTWGKGTVQNVIPLEAGQAALKLTTASYWRPSENNIHRRKDASEDDDWGVRPDTGFEVDLDEEQADRIRRMRRDRDTVHTNGVQDNESDPALKPTEVDPQLQLAVNHLLEILSPFPKPQAEQLITESDE